MKIAKFGGSSLGSPARIRNVIQLVLKMREKNSRLAIVFSAFQGVTDTLIQLAKLASEGDKTYLSLLKSLNRKHLAAVQLLVNRKRRSRSLSLVRTILDELEKSLQGVFLIREASPRTLDFIMSFGERLSARIISEILKGDLEAEFLDARQLVKTDDQFGRANVLIHPTYNGIRNYFLNHEGLQVITGFIGSTLQGETTCLGRGGSDYTASLFGAALEASEIEIWSDVDGMMTADPQKVKKAFPISALNYNEAVELSHFGAKVIYPPTIQPALKASIPIRIKNSFNPEFQGTLISDKTSKEHLIRGVSSLSPVALLRVEGSGMIGVAGMSMRLFGALARKKINVILISQASSEHSICFAVLPNDADLALKAAAEEFEKEISSGSLDSPTAEPDCSIVAAVGEKMRNTPGISGRMFAALGRNGINVRGIAQGSSELNISAVIKKSDESKGLNALHEAFFLSDTKTLNLFMIGAGLIGGTLLRQIHKQLGFLRESCSYEIRLAALADSKNMIFKQEGISTSNWARELNHADETSDLSQFVQKMKELNLPNSIFIDCTASERVVSYYEEILNSMISIVTPNKKANSGSYLLYKRVRELTRLRGVKFLYETNVGAGLPILNTLKDLLASGDKILKIEAVLSGSLSFIFNNFLKGKTFSSIVREAKERGYTEPDPMDDLNGLDAARKLLILGREIGYPLEMKGVKVEPILPRMVGIHASNPNRNISKFFVELEKNDLELEKRRFKAEKNGGRLQYIGSLENGRAEIKLVEVNPSHPFYHLSGSDNMISFKTQRYFERPLVVKGPGAGAEVTAAGVFADILRIANTLP